MYQLGDPLPRLAQPVHRAADEGGTDLQDAVVVVHAATDVGNGRPFLDARHAVLDVGSTHDLRYHQTTRLQPSRGIIPKRPCAKTAVCQSGRVPKRPCMDQSGN